MIGRGLIFVLLVQFSFLPFVVLRNGNTFYPPVMYKTVKLVCRPNANYIQNATCKLKAINWEKALTTMECDIVKTISNCYLHLEIFKQNNANIYSPFFINVTSNACELLDNKIYPAYTTIVKKILGAVSNVNHSCPLTGRLIVKDMYLEQKYFPIIAPIGMYKIVFRFFEGTPNDDIGTVEIYIQVAEKPILRFVKNGLKKRQEKARYHQVKEYELNSS